MAGEAVDPRDMAPQEADIPEEEVITLEVVTEGEVITAVAAGVAADITAAIGVVEAAADGAVHAASESPAPRTRTNAAYITM